MGGGGGGQTGTKCPAITKNSILFHISANMTDICQYPGFDGQISV